MHWRSWEICYCCWCVWLTSAECFTQIILVCAFKWMGSGTPICLIWDTASVSYDISYDNIVWAKPLTLIPIVPWDKIESWEIPNVHTQRKPWKPLFCFENNSAHLSRWLKRVRNISHILTHGSNTGGGVTDGALRDNCWVHPTCFPLGSSVHTGKQSKNVQK